MHFCKEVAGQDIASTSSGSTEVSRLHHHHFLDTSTMVENRSGKKTSCRDSNHGPVPSWRRRASLQTAVEHLVHLQHGVENDTVTKRTKPNSSYSIENILSLPTSAAAGTSDRCGPQQSSWPAALFASQWFDPRLPSFFINQLSPPATRQMFVDASLVDDSK